MRVGWESDNPPKERPVLSHHKSYKEASNTGFLGGSEKPKKEFISGQGRFPANLIHDNSEEVRECFPETKSGAMNSIAKANQYNTFGKMQ
jgi:hypothetical protein